MALHARSHVAGSGDLDCVAQWPFISLSFIFVEQVGNGIIELRQAIRDSHFPFAGEGAEGRGVSDGLDSVSCEGKVSCSIFPINACRPALCSVWVFPR